MPRVNIIVIQSVATVTYQYILHNNIMTIPHLIYLLSIYDVINNSWFVSKILEYKYLNIDLECN